MQSGFEIPTRLEQKGRVAGVIDVRTPILEHVAKRRKEDPGYTVAGDGIHPNKTGHRLMGEAILRAWGVTPVKPDPKLLTLIDRKVKLLGDAWRSHVGHKRPGVRKGLPLSTRPSRRRASWTRRSSSTERT